MDRLSSEGDVNMDKTNQPKDRTKLLDSFATGDVGPTPHVKEEIDNMLSSKENEE